MTKRILIVEDNALNRDMLGRRLTRRGYAISYAIDGPGGVAAATSDRPDLILMDIGLGEMDGLEATRLIKGNPDTSPIPVIALTASAFESDRRRSMEAGCSDFDTKPVDLDRLLAKMETCLAASAIAGPEQPPVDRDAGLAVPAG